MAKKTHLRADPSDDEPLTFGIAEDARVQDYFTFKIQALSREHTRGIRQILEKRFGLSLVEWRVMSWIATSDANTVREISRISYLAKSRISHGLSVLVHRGLAVGKADPADGRNRVFALTAKGRQIFARVTRWHRQRQRELSVDLDAEEYAVMMRALDKLLARFRADRDGEPSPVAAQTRSMSRSKGSPGRAKARKRKNRTKVLP